MADLITIAQSIVSTLPAAEVATDAAAEAARGSVAIGKGIAYGVAGGGAGVGIGLVVAATLNGMARQPEQAGQLKTLMFIGVAFIELVFLFGIVLTFILK
ncbi:MAG: ATP synthase F0 subunit C [Planctomycetota bacterium]